MLRRKGQVWVETVIYTLIGLSLIGLVLGVAVPKINEAKDLAIIEQSMGVLNGINEKILAVKDVSGRTRVTEIRIKNGEIILNPDGDTIFFILRDTDLEFSQENVDIVEGDLIIRTEEENKKNNVIIRLGYDNINISYDMSDVNHTIQASPSQYRLSIKNNGLIDEKINVDLKVI